MCTETVPSTSIFTLKASYFVVLAVAYLCVKCLIAVNEISLIILSFLFTIDEVKGLTIMHTRDCFIPQAA